MGMGAAGHVSHNCRTPGTERRVRISHPQCERAERAHGPGERAELHCGRWRRAQRAAGLGDKHIMVTIMPLTLLWLLMWRLLAVSAAGFLPPAGVANSAA